MFKELASHSAYRSTTRTPMTWVLVINPAAHLTSLEDARHCVGISSIVVSGNTTDVKELRQRDIKKSIILSMPLLYDLKEGSNTSTVGGLRNGNDTLSADLDHFVVYHPEE